MSKNVTILKNGLYLVFRTLLISLIGLFTVREVLRLLGVEEYGLFNLVFGVAALFAFINGAMISSTQRYFSFYIGKKNEKLLDAAWQTSLFLHFLIAVVVSITLLCFKNLILNSLLSISLVHIDAASFVFNLAALSIFFSIFQSPFNALILAKEKMSFYAILSLYDAVSKLLIVYLLYYLSDPLLEKYTSLYVGSSLIVFFSYIMYCQRKFNKNIRLGIENVKLLKEMFFYSSWNIFGNFAFVAKMQGINILLNIFFGIIINSAYALTNTITGVINGLTNSIMIAINPQIYKSYAEGDSSRNILLINSGSKYSFFFCLIVVSPIYINMNFLLELWLHEIPLYLMSFLKLALIGLLLESLSGSLITAVQATGQVKKYQIILGALIFSNIPVSYMILKYFGNPDLVYIVSITITIFCYLIRIIFLKKLINFDIIIYLKDVVIRVALVSLSSFFLIYLLKNNFDITESNLSFFITSLLVVASICISILCFGLSKFEVAFLLKKFFSRNRV